MRGPERPHSALGYETPAAFTDELNKKWPVPLRPSGSASQAIAPTAPMRENNWPNPLPLLDEIRTRVQNVCTKIQTKAPYCHLLWQDCIILQKFTQAIP
jgi:hypothetical protein